MAQPEAVILSIFLSGNTPTHNFQASDKLPNDLVELAKWDIIDPPASLFPSVEFSDPQGKGAVHLRFTRERRTAAKGSGEELVIWAPTYIVLSPAGKPIQTKDPVETLLRDGWELGDTGTVVAAFPSTGVVYLIHRLIKKIP
jgi:hypothetical protein